MYFLAIFPFNATRADDSARPADLFPPFSSILCSVTLFSRDLTLYAALGSCLVLGLRHGFDYDHLAAISDITAVQRNWLSGLRGPFPKTEPSSRWQDSTCIAHP